MEGQQLFELGLKPFLTLLVRPATQIKRLLFEFLECFGNQLFVVFLRILLLLVTQQNEMLDLNTKSQKDIIFDFEPLDQNFLLVFNRGIVVKCGNLYLERGLRHNHFLTGYWQFSCSISAQPF